MERQTGRRKCATHHLSAVNEGKDTPGLTFPATNNRPTLSWTPVKLRGQTVPSYTCPPAHRRRSITEKKKQTRWWCTLTACIRVNYGNGMQSSAWCHLTRQKHLNTPAIPLSGKQRGHLGWVGLWVFWQEQSRRNPVTQQRHPTVCSTQRQVDEPPQNLPGCRNVSPYIPHVWNSTEAWMADLVIWFSF